MTVPNYLRVSAQKFVERAEALKLRGKKRDDAALDYFVGVAQGLSAAGAYTEAAHVGTVCAYVIAVRGYFEVARIASSTEA